MQADFINGKRSATACSGKSGKKVPTRVLPSHRQIDQAILSILHKAAKTHVPVDLKS